MPEQPLDPTHGAMRSTADAVDRRVLLTQQPDDSPWTGAKPSRSSLPPILARTSRRRLQLVGWVMVAVLAFNWFLINLIEGDLPVEFEDPLQGGPPLLIIVCSVATILLARRPRLSAWQVQVVGLSYEVSVSFGLAFAQYWKALTNFPAELVIPDILGYSSVAMWMLMFTVLVPSRPRHALVGLTLSGSAVPVTVALMITLGQAPQVSAPAFVFTFVLPYIVVVPLAYIAARVIYGLGREVRRAQEMGSYQLTERIGQGGMGEVWRARHRMLARPAAIKLVRMDGLASAPASRETSLARFEREAQVTAQLQSPHTVELYDFGRSDAGELYYVMELLDGVDLETLVEEFGPLEAPRVAHVLLQVCHSLAEAHHQGLIHRDIKPANIFLCQRALDYDFVKVLDFGLVKRSRRLESGQELSMTAANTIPGTPAYVAPEVALGKPGIDGRADLYALGCVAYWLLSGRRVFDDETPVGQVVAHVQIAPEPPSSRTEVAVPPELEAVVMACLAKDPDDRPQSADVLASRLRDTGLADDWSNDRARQWWRRHQPDKVSG